MKCHNCQTKTEVEETRVLPENPRWTKRRRVCKQCGYRLWTIEMPAEDVVVKDEAQPEQYDQTALELCEKCGWKAIMPDEGCLVCARQELR